MFVYPQVFGPSGDILALNNNNQGQLQYPILTFINATTPFPVINDTDKFRPSGLKWEITISGTPPSSVILSNAYDTRFHPAVSGIYDFSIFNAYMSNSPLGSSNLVTNAAINAIDIYNRLSRNI